MPRGHGADVGLIGIAVASLYAHFDEFGASPVPDIEAMLRWYIQPCVLQHDDTETQPHRTMYGGALQDFAAMTKTDGDDEVMEPFSDDIATGGVFKVLPLAMFTAMQPLLSRFSSAHGLG